MIIRRSDGEAGVEAAPPVPVCSVLLQRRGAEFQGSIGPEPGSAKFNCRAGEGPRSAALGQVEQARRVQPVGCRLDVFAAVFTDRDDDLDLATGARHKKPPLPGLNPGDRGLFADFPAGPVGVDAADLADPAMMVEEVAASDAVDLVTRWHRPVVQLSFCLAKRNRNAAGETAGARSATGARPRPGGASTDQEAP